VFLIFTLAERKNEKQDNRNYHSPARPEFIERQAIGPADATTAYVA
jgi:hypothetical protein